MKKTYNILIIFYELKMDENERFHDWVKKMNYKQNQKTGQNMLTLLTIATPKF